MGYKLLLMWNMMLRVVTVRLTLLGGKSIMGSICGDTQMAKY